MQAQQNQHQSNIWSYHQENNEILSSNIKAVQNKINIVTLPIQKKRKISGFRMNQDSFIGQQQSNLCCWQKPLNSSYYYDNKAKTSLARNTTIFLPQTNQHVLIRNHQTYHYQQLGITSQLDPIGVRFIDSDNKVNLIQPREGNMENRWKDVSRLFYEKSGGRLYRCSKQCRQQWLNHLDSSKIQGQWSQDEDLKILQAVIQHGHKWAMISKDLLPSRTQHMIKNRFNSLIGKRRTRKQLRSYNERKIIRKLISRLKDKNSSVKSQSKNDQSVIKIAYEPSFGQNLNNVIHTQLAIDDLNKRERYMEQKNEDFYISPKEQLSDKSPLVDFPNTFAYMNPHMFAVPQSMTAQMSPFVPNLFLVGNAYCGFAPSFFMGGF